MLSATFNESLKKKLNILPELIMFFNLLLVLCVIGLECFIIIYPKGDVSDEGIYLLKQEYRKDKCQYDSYKKAMELC